MSIEVRIKKDFGSFQLNIAFESDSRRIGILGASGCGKSMTLKSLAGIERPDEGRIVVNGKVMFDSARKIQLRPQVRKVGYLFQNYALFPTMTVEQNIAVGIQGKRTGVQEKVMLMLKRFHLEGLEKRLPDQLSGGQQQRVALARIMVYEPEVILLDEPFSALDIYLRDQMQRELMDLLKEYQGIVIMVSHNRDEVYRMSDELLVLDGGKIVGQGKTKQLFAEPGNVIAARLTGCKNIADAVRTEDGIYIDDWKLTLPVSGKMESDFKAVAIRAHKFRMQAAGKNRYFTFPVLDPIVTEDLFEYNISFKTAQEAVQRIDWKISNDIWKYDQEKMPEQLYLKEEDLLLLRESSAAETETL